ncbi:hypothetical protein FBU59_001150 [Linderina macrospora]|uniref:Uncharacterized protein n=1 Tax=Linderina macrospora TaxID=4868 RepID=A0ACC1JF09_9FUNG|nr:hypothetical protein FBU59_001150 [Linderina macrospora]
MAKTTTTTKVMTRQEQKEYIIKKGGRVLKFTDNGGELYFRYYFPHPEQLTWYKLVSGLRVLFSVTQEDLYIQYTDDSGSKINVTDDGGLRIMFEETAGTDYVLVHVITDARASRMDSAAGLDSRPSVPMPMPSSGFPGMAPSRAGSDISFSSLPTGPGGRPPRPPVATSMAPGPVPQSMGAMPSGPVPMGPGYGNVSNMSNSTLPPPRPQQPLSGMQSPM